MVLIPATSGGWEWVDPLPTGRLGLGSWLPRLTLFHASEEGGFYENGCRSPVCDGDALGEFVAA